jgi:hypothetical protein
VAYFDSHTHLYLRGAEDLQAMAGAGVRATVVCAFLPVKPSGAATLQDLFAWLCDSEPLRQAQYGMRALAAVGVHPRCIPDTGLEEVLQAVDRRLTTRSAAALGEVGLETGSAEEVEVLRVQLALARSRNSPVIVHTPRAEKVKILDQLLPLLERSRVDPAKVIVDHLTPELVGKVRERGFNVGLTVQPGKLAPEDVLAVVREHGCEGILVDSDSAHVTADPLAVPKVARCLEAAGISPAEIARVTWENASRLLAHLDA